MNVVDIIFWFVMTPCVGGILYTLYTDTANNNIEAGSLKSDRSGSIEDMDLIGVQIPYITDYDKLLEQTKYSHFYENQFQNT